MYKPQGIVINLDQASSWNKRPTNPSIADVNNKYKFTFIYSYFFILLAFRFAILSLSFAANS
jgi:hypothetical protein